MKRFVAYFDVLGFTQLVESSVDKAEHILRLLQKSILIHAIKVRVADKAAGVIFKNTIEKASFSDSVLFVSRSDGIDDFKNFLILMNHFFVGSIGMGIPLRGGMSCGEMEFDKSMEIYFGRPFVEAYKMSESSPWLGVVAGEGLEDYHKKIMRVGLEKRPSMLVRHKISAEASESLVLNWPKFSGWEIDTPMDGESFYNGQKFFEYFGSFMSLENKDRMKYENTATFANRRLQTGK